MHRARARGVVEDASKAKKTAKVLKEEMLLRAWIEESGSPESTLCF